MTSQHIRPPHPILLQFAYEWAEAGRPTNHSFSTNLLPSAEAISIVRQINSWRLKVLDHFRDFKAPLGIKGEEANDFLRPLLGMEWPALNSLRFRTLPSNNIKATFREIVIYLPAPITMHSSPQNNNPIPPPCGPVVEP